MAVSPELEQLLEDQQDPKPLTAQSSHLLAGNKPAYNDMEKVYKMYIKNQDLVRKVKNECAIRMSIALSVNGFSFERFSGNKELKPARLHNGGKTGIPVTHVNGARELAVYLKKEWGSPIIFKRKLKAGADKELSGQKGIIYFNNCSGPGRSHIDLWDGKNFYNQILKISAHVEFKSKKNLFFRSDEVWFWKIQ